MAEALAIVGALSSFLQLVDFTAKVTSHAREILNANEDNLHQNTRTQDIIKNYKDLVNAIKKGLAGSPATSQSEQERTITALGEQIEEESDGLLAKLEGLSIDPDSKGIKRKTEAARKAVKYVTKRKELEHAQNRVQELNGQLATVMLQELLARQHAFAEPSLRAFATARNMSGGDVEKAVAFLRECKLLKERADQLMRSLQFPEMNTRQDAIDQAYPKTYQWALDSEDLPLRPWLNGDTNIFWVTGKAGSGKSTLMKFVSENPQTKALLARCHHCANCKSTQSGPCDKPVESVFASFYFWYAGTTLQKSTVGLLRTMLHSILINRPELIQTAFPNLVTTSEVRSIERTWSFDELLQALKAVARHQTLGQQKRVCLFIDGLDEYSGNMLDLIGIIRELGSSAGSNFRLCVSSRPWTAFRNAFEYTVPNLRLEGLSRHDIHQYVDGSVRHGLSQSQQGAAPNAITADALCLIDEIVNKAEGVFLWVILVVKSVLRGFAERDPVSMLLHRVRCFPADLEDFFRDILGRVDREYKSHTYQALKLACLYAGADDTTRSVSSFIDYWFIRQSPQGLLSPTFADAHLPRAILPAELEQMQLDTQATLSAACKDLLCLPHHMPFNLSQLPANRVELRAPVKVEFLHRTVHDFLRTDEMTAMLDIAVPAHFLDGHVLHLLELASLRYMPQGWGKYKESRMQSAAKMLKRVPPHQVTEQYMAAFEEVILHYYGNKLEVDRAHLRRLFLATFVALQRNAFVIRLLEDANKPSLPERAKEDLQREITMAAFGGDAHFPFDVAQASMKVIRRLDAVGLLRHTWSRKGDHSDCLWGLFLRYWDLSSDEDSSESCDPKATTRLRKLWNLAVCFLEKSASLDTEYCSVPQDRNVLAKHLHRRQKASVLLSSQVPKKWLEERKDTGALAKITLATKNKRKHDQTERAPCPGNKKKKARSTYE
ncbi:hypothetical protein LTR17_012072 [Elasticomyces elasticus]|nr:hypothetical protein LTR17_012072 [Elasticomyces elasticus]